MRDFDESEAHAHGDGHDRAHAPHGSGAEAQRHRLHIYRTAIARLRAERAAGEPAAQATWRVSHEIHDRFALDARHCALLIRCLIAASDGV
ncbi:MAG: hypothetical protein ACR2JW_02480 [Thermomicrobiales bacterium]